jgi:hypothetical protein
MEDLVAGTEDAAERGEIPTLSEDELKHLFDIFAGPDAFMSVERGKEVTEINSILYPEGFFEPLRRTFAFTNRQRRAGLQPMTDGGLQAVGRIIYLDNAATTYRIPYRRECLQSMGVWVFAWPGRL